MDQYESARPPLASAWVVPDDVNSNVKCPVCAPPRRPARPRPSRAAAPAPVVSSLLAALIRTPLSCRPADLTLTRAIERVGHARRHRHRARSTASGPAWARWGVAYYSRLRGGGGERCGVPHGRRTTVFHRVDRRTRCGRCLSLPSRRTRIAMRINIPNIPEYGSNTHAVLLIHRLPPYYG